MKALIAVQCLICSCKAQPSRVEGEEGDVAAAMVPILGDSPHGTPIAAVGPGGCL